MPTTFRSVDPSRRVDHEEFMRGAAPPISRGTSDKPEQTTPSSPRRRAGPSTNPIPRSFAYGAPSEVSQSSSSTTRSLLNTSGRPNIHTSAVNPSEPNTTSHPLHDTSVQIANAIAKATTMTGISQSQSTLVGTVYSSSNTLVGSSQAPSSSLRPPNSSQHQRRVGKPVSTGSSSSHRANDHDNDDDKRGIRGLSPVEALSEQARHKSPFTFALREAGSSGTYQSMMEVLSQQQPPPSDQSIANSVDDTTQLESRDYDEEDNYFDDLKDKATRKASRKTRPKTNDNKAYRPGSDAEESSDDDVSDGGRRRRKKALPGRSTLDGSLPMLSAEKKRKANRGGRKGGSLSGRRALEEPGGSGASDAASRGQSPQAPSIPPSEDAQADQISFDLQPDDDDSVAEIPPPAPDERAFNESLRSASSAGFSPGALLGSTVYFLRQFFMMSTVLTWQTLQGIYTMVLSRPLSWLSSTNPKGLVALSIIIAIFALQALTSTSTSDPVASRGLFSSIFGRSPVRRPVFVPPTTLPDNWDELSSQLLAMQTEVSALSDQVQHSDSLVLSSNSNIRRQLDSISRRADDVDAKISRFSSDVQDTFAGLIRRVERREGDERQPEVSSIDNERLARYESSLEKMQEWIRRVEATAESTAPLLRELDKKIQAMATTSDSKTRSGKELKNPPDVTPALKSYFEQLLLQANKDRIGRADYAIYSGGGRIIPSLTSSTYEIRPRRSWFSALTGLGQQPGPQGRPPVTALVPDINVGNCWPFSGTTGTLGIYLSRHAHVSSFSIDHAAKELVFDITPAPRRVQVWGVVDGADNLAKLSDYRNDIAERKERGMLNNDELVESDTEVPHGLPPSLEYLPLGSFEYDAGASDNVQTFDVPGRIQKLGIDVGVVLFDIRSNWGNPDYTCLYRVRVHGTELIPASSSPPASET